MAGAPADPIRPVRAQVLRQAWQRRDETGFPASATRRRRRPTTSRPSSRSGDDARWVRSTPSSSWWSGRRRRCFAASSSPCWPGRERQRAFDELQARLAADAPLDRDLSPGDRRRARAVRGRAPADDAGHRVGPGGDGRDPAGHLHRHVRRGRRGGAHGCCTSGPIRSARSSSTWPPARPSRPAARGRSPAWLPRRRS